MQIWKTAGDLSPLTAKTIELKVHRDYVRIEKSFEGLPTLIAKSGLDKKLSRNFYLPFEPPHCAILDCCNININKFITFKTKAIYRR
jgi:hypothetical protein